MTAIPECPPPNKQWLGSTYTVSKEHADWLRDRLVEAMELLRQAPDVLWVQRANAAEWYASRDAWRDAISRAKQAGRL